MIESSTCLNESYSDLFFTYCNIQILWKHPCGWERSNSPVGAVWLLGSNFIGVTRWPVPSLVNYGHFKLVNINFRNSSSVIVSSLGSSSQLVVIWSIPLCTAAMFSSNWTLLFSSVVLTNGFKHMCSTCHTSSCLQVAWSHLCEGVAVSSVERLTIHLVWLLNKKCLDAETYERTKNWMVAVMTGHCASTQLG